MNKDIESLIRPNIRSLCPYSTARDDYKGSLGVFLDANESPYPTSWNRYPDPRQTAVKKRLSAIKGIPVENIFLGNGSDEAIDLVYRIFCEPGRSNAVVISPSYGMYSVCAEINDVEVRQVPLGPDFSLPVEELLAACDSNTRLMFVCSPNNPSGNAFTAEEILSLADRFGGILVVDEAYADFSRLGSIRQEVLKRKDIIVLQTLSKAWGLAALRLGIAFADSRIIDLMSMVKYPYNISQATQNEVLKALATPVDDKIAEIVSEREKLAALLPEFGFILKVWPSEANFLLVQTPDPNALYDHLVKDGIIVRNRNSVAPGCLRITTGLKEENDKLIESLREYEKGNIR